MLRLLGLGVCLILAGAQEPADKVRELVEKLGSEEIAVRDQAQGDLIKLEPAALPAIRKHLAKAEGELKVRLQTIVRKIERDERIARIMAPGPVVTLRVKDRPASEVLTEISRQAGVTVEPCDLPAGTLLSLEADRLSLPAVIDKVCRQHGGITPQWYDSRIRVLPGSYRKLLAFDAGPFRFIPAGFEWSVGRTGDDYHAALVFKGVVIGPPGRMPPLARLDFEEAIDDQGVDLGVTKSWGLSLDAVEWPDASRVDHDLSRMVSRRTVKSPRLEAEKLLKCRGAVRLTFIYGSKRIATVEARVKTKREWEAIAKAAEKQESESRSGLVIDRCVRVGRTLRLDYRAYHLATVRDDPDAPSVGPTWLALHDASGRRLEGVNELDVDYGFVHGSHTLRGTEQRAEGTLRFNLPEGFEPATLDLMEGTDLEEVRIPFDLGEVPLK